MSSLIVVLLLSMWLFVGWLILDWAKVGDGIQRGLLAPAVGMAAIMLVTTTASFAGMPVGQSAFVVAAILGLLVCVFRRANWSGIGVAGSLQVLIVLANVGTVGIGLLWFGGSWQGFVNEDAATSSLAAQYFTEHGFFSRPSVESIAGGLDYSALSSVLYVEGGHRFGDVMLLALTATLFQMAPDQAYMAHALAIRCVLISVAALLIYRAGDATWRLVFAIVCLTVAPLGAYMYLNQLISQTGGLALLFSAGILVAVVLRQPPSLARGVVPAAILVAALCQYYPEAMPFLALSLLLFGAWQAAAKQLPPVRVLIKPLSLMLVAVVVLLNVALPNTIASMLALLRWGATKSEIVDKINPNFAYAFTPDFPAILLGFQKMGEGLNDPWSTILAVIACVSIIALTVFAFRNRQRYALLMSFSAAAAISFLFLFVQRNGFGTFKVMLLVQPLLFVLLAVALCELFVARRYVGLFAVAALSAVLGRTSYGYVQQATRPLGAVPYMAQHHLLEQVSKASETSPDGLVVDVPTILSGKFAVLRIKTNPVIFEQNFAGTFASKSLRTVLRRGAVHESLLPNHEAFWATVDALYTANYAAEAFRCFPNDSGPEFAMLRRDDGKKLARLLPGGMLAPLNRTSLAREDFMLLPNVSTGSYLAFRPSARGGYYGAIGANVAMYNLEADPLVQGSSMAAIGRFVLLEILSETNSDIRLAINFTRTFLGGSDTKLPRISIFGEAQTTMLSAGAGAMSMLSEPLTPCVIVGRKFVLLDFGVDAIQFRKAAPLAYRWLDVPYSPDTRRLVGFLRDVSIVPLETRVAEPTVRSASGPWNFERFDSAFEFSGMFEDGWVSDQLFLRARSGWGGGKLTLSVDVPGGPTAKDESTISIEVDGKFLRAQKIAPGSVKIEIDLHQNPRALVKLSVDPPFTLPGADGRPVMGLLRSIAQE